MIYEEDGYDDAGAPGISCLLQSCLKPCVCVCAPEVGKVAMALEGPGPGSVRGGLGWARAAEGPGRGPVRVQAGIP